MAMKDIEDGSRLPEGGAARAVRLDRSLCGRCPLQRGIGGPWNEWCRDLWSISHRPEDEPPCGRGLVRIRLAPMYLFRLRYGTPCCHVDVPADWSFFRLVLDGGEMGGPASPAMSLTPKKTAFRELLGNDVDWAIERDDAVRLMGAGAVMEHEERLREHCPYYAEHIIMEENRR